MINMNNKLIKIVGIICIGITLLTACNNTTPESKDLLYDFHKTFSDAYKHQLTLDSTALYVDYTNGLAMKGKIKFYWEIMKPILEKKIKSYYSIKGQDIKREVGDVKTLLGEVTNFENPNLKGALEKIVNSDNEAILITDAELANPSDPFMKDAFTTWLMKGHDIFIIVEPYIEAGVKKNIFYFIFSDTKLDGNLTDYVKRVGKIHYYPKIFSMNLSTMPYIKGMKGGHSDPNGFVQAMVTRNGDFELQEWSTGWEDKIEKYVLNITDKKGNDLKESAVLIDGLQLDKNSLGGMIVDGVKMKVYNINKEYSDFYKARNENSELNMNDVVFDEYDNFLLLDSVAFKRNSVFKIYFDRENYDKSILNGSPYNYFKICFYINDIKENIEAIKEPLMFEDRFKKGYKNVSVFESVKQTIEDKDLSEFMANNPIYTIYVKSLDK